MNNKKLASVAAAHQLPRLGERQNHYNSASSYKYNMPVNSSGNNGNGLVYSDDGQRCIGRVKHGVFTKSNWHSKRHLCRKYRAIGIDKQAFKDYISPEATLIECFDKDTSTLYRINISDFTLHAIEDDLGWGPQLFCPIKYFEAEKQLAFWGGGQ